MCKRILIFLLLFLKTFSTAHATTKYLLLGGNTDPYNSQFTLEKNIQDFQNILQTEIEKDNVITHFGLGNKKLLDVTVIDKTFTVDETLFSELFPSRYYPDRIVRHNHLNNITGPILFDEIMLSAHDLIETQDKVENYRFYYTGHGIKDDETDNYCLSMGIDSLYVTDLATYLDKYQENKHWQLVFSQCHSGGFTRINYVDGIPSEKNLSPANRCAFCSTLSHLISTGCSANADFSEEYSRYFREAFFEKKTQADFNHDGFITSNEAHIYTYINSKNIDIPTRTSDALLRDATKNYNKLLSWTELYQLMDVEEKAAILALSKKASVELPSISHPILFVENIKQQKLEAYRQQQHVKEKSLNDFQKIFTYVQSQYIQKHPEMYNVYGANHQSTRLITASFIKKLKSNFYAHPEYKKIKEKYLNFKMQDQALWEVDTQWALWSRILYLLETQAYKAEIKKDENKKYYKKFLQLKSCESQPFFVQTE